MSVVSGTRIRNKFGVTHERKKKNMVTEKRTVWGYQFYEGQRRRGRGREGHEFGIDRTLWGKKHWVQSTRARSTCGQDYRCAISSMYVYLYVCMFLCSWVKGSSTDVDEQMNEQTCSRYAGERWGHWEGKALSANFYGFRNGARRNTAWKESSVAIPWDDEGG